MNSITLILKLIFPLKENLLLQLVTAKEMFATNLPPRPLMETGVCSNKYWDIVTPRSPLGWYAARSSQGSARKAKFG